jgi:hypothetical protein
MGWGSGIRFLAEGGIFLFTAASTPALGVTQLPNQLVPWTLSPVVKWREREADHSPPSSAEVENSKAVSPLATRPHGVVLNLLSTGTTCHLLFEGKVLWRIAKPKREEEGHEVIT